MRTDLLWAISLESPSSSQTPEHDHAESQSTLNPDQPPRRSIIPDILNRTFHAVDAELSQMAAEGRTHSGCTAVTAFLRLEDETGSQPVEFLSRAAEWQRASVAMGVPTASEGGSVTAGASTIDTKEKDKDGKERDRHGSGFGKVKQVVLSITGKSPTSEPEDLHHSSPQSPSRSSLHSNSPPLVSSSPLASSAASLSPSTSSNANSLAPYSPSNITPSASVTDHTSVHSSISAQSNTTSSPSEILSATTFNGAVRRVLYTANAGDARAVLSRGGRAVRLTYDHKGSDAQEARRIKEAGGFVMNNRVNGASVSFLRLLCWEERDEADDLFVHTGVLAVTRSLGDSSMKEFVVGSPYTTETQLGPDDDLLIIACDGVRAFLSLL